MVMYFPFGKTAGSNRSSTWAVPGENAMNPLLPVAVIGPDTAADSVVPITRGTVWSGMGAVTVAGLACVPFTETVELRSSRLETFR